MKYIELARKILDENLFVGVRTLNVDEQYAVGDECRESYEWDFANDCSAYYTTGAKAGGTCATHIDTQYFETDDEVTELAVRIEEMIEKNKEYGNGRQVIIAGHSVNNDGYFDPDEIRIVDAYVIAIIN